MKLLRNIVLAGAMALGCAGCNKAEIVESTPEKLIVDLDNEGRFAYNGTNCILGTQKMVDMPLLSNEQYSVKAINMIYDAGCDNRMDALIQYFLYVPKDGSEPIEDRNELSRDLYETLGDNRPETEMDPLLKKVRKDYNLDKLMQEWDRQYKK